MSFGPGMTAPTSNTSGFSFGIQKSTAGQKVDDLEVDCNSSKEAIIVLSNRF